MFKMLRGKSSPNFDSLFERSKNLSTRGHSVKLMKHRCTTDLRKYFFSEWVIDRWNMLTEDCVSSCTISEFKGKLTRIRNNKMSFFMDHWWFLKLYGYIRPVFYTSLVWPHQVYTRYISFVLCTLGPLYHQKSPRDSEWQFSNYQGSNVKVSQSETGIQKWANKRCTYCVSCRFIGNRLLGIRKQQYSLLMTSSWHIMTSRLACWLGGATWRTWSPTDQPVIWPIPMNSCHWSMITPPQHFSGACQFVPNHQRRKEKKKKTWAKWYAPLLLRVQTLFAWYA